MTQTTPDEKNSIDALLDAIRSREASDITGGIGNPAVADEDNETDADTTDSYVVDEDDVETNDAPSVRGPIVLPAMYNDSERTSSVEDGHVSDHLAAHWGF